MCPNQALNPGLQAPSESPTLESGTLTLFLFEPYDEHEHIYILSELATFAFSHRNKI